MASKQQTMGFQTEVKQMLNIVIHSLYSNKEIFLRELISNASDALDKLRFLALSDASLYEGDSDLKITIDCNEKLKTITIKDNGIGMSWDEAVSNLGTIAKSGTKEFLSQLTGEKAKDSHLIGQFGVGFYSAFIVADKVTVKSRRAGLSAEEGIVWESTGDGEFTIAQENKAHHGTEITLHLKEDDLEFASDWRIRSIITKYSDHICWPIVMKKAEDENKESSDFETVNKATALWTLQKSEISEDEYKTLYKHISHDFQEPLIWSHNHVEGKNNYISLLYIPSHAPYDLWQQETKHGLKLYVKRVFILDDAAQFLPRYLRFVKGIIDASDLPLNISREILQDNKQVDSIRAACAKRILGMLEKLAEQEPEKYQKFWNEFGQVLKEGPIEDFVNREAIAKLLRFTSTHTNSEKQDVTLADYVSRMKEGQDKIYYITASSYNAAKHSPHLEIFRKKGIEVLLLSDRIDEWLVGYLSEFDGKKLQSISKGKIDLDVEETNSEEAKKEEESLNPMLKQIKDILGDKVKEVVLTHRLTDSPACIVADEQDMGLEMQRILQAAGQQVPESKPVFEINPQHALIKRLHGIEDDSQFGEWVTVLFEQAVLAEGGQLDNPADFVSRVNKLLLSA
ncbi:Class III heat-shock protein HtpG(molecular chaperone) [Legionella quinlivanii]|uniref:Chaperone protein HtpG n=1 Tax=Legionella quinlivanii TaxID=45073 RepID=A0A0W0Y3S1_9GAMM|nr:molecular chaperone HtpG [Legionella quinlivanii]KTD51561.1 Class III heat-shock protein HtpG(molecular chaperone) [Legionella quinlivanii]MCW8450899.1 molecular chaperone HtpG [Legionella quinlivanii]SEF59065.1 molecular chaperone HtpG [Legionella quinlivanii DSM 21216]STY10912.1 Class III heat-shock protein HtpG(molecular chaperone) [Legionella quinlivanii]